MARIWTHSSACSDPGGRSRTSRPHSYGTTTGSTKQIYGGRCTATARVSRPICASSCCPRTQGRRSPESCSQARYTSAGQGNDYDTATATFTATGKKELAAATQAWERYLQLTKSPDPNLAILAARAYAALGNYAGEASAWEIETLANPSEAKGYECLAASAYAAKQTRKGDLAAAKALSLVPAIERLTLKQTLNAAKTNPQIAQQC